MAAQTYIGTVTIQTCCSCGLTFGIDESWDRARRQDHKPFYCPAGHAQSYTGLSEVEKLRREKQRLEEDAEWLSKQWTQSRQEAAAARRQAGIEKGKATRLRKRIAAGVCPCCNRTFSGPSIDALKRHLAEQHPDFTVPTA